MFSAFANVRALLDTMFAGNDKYFFPYSDFSKAVTLMSL